MEEHARDEESNLSRPVSGFDFLVDKIDSVDKKIDLVEKKLSDKIDSSYRELNGKINIIFWILGIGFGVGFGGVFTMLAVIISRLFQIS